MSATSDLIRKLGSLGATAEMIAAAVEAVETTIEARRSVDRERKRRQRVKSRDVTGQDVTSGDPLSKEKVSPKPLSKTQPISKPPSPLTGAHGSKFEEFWLACPRKVGKGAARTAFSRALRKADSPAILAGLERAKTGWRDLEPQFIPHPATWLNQERWTDEPDEPAGLRVVRDDDFAARALAKFRKNRGIDGESSDYGSAELAR